LDRLGNVRRFEIIAARKIGDARCARDAFERTRLRTASRNLRVASCYDCGIKGVDGVLFKLLI
jgi:hypothetical protein